jgi:hypothetical protein
MLCALAAAAQPRNDPRKQCAPHTRLQRSSAPLRGVCVAFAFAFRAACADHSCLPRSPTGYDTDNFAPEGPAQLSFVEEFQSGTLALIASLPPGTGVYSPTCLVHCLSGQTSFTTLTAAANMSLATALSAWYFAGAAVQAVSPCIGWSCIHACGVNLDTGLPCDAGTAGCSPLTLASDHQGSTSTDTIGRDTSDVGAEMRAVLDAPQYSAGGVLPAIAAAAAMSGNGSVLANETALSAAQKISLAAIIADEPPTPLQRARRSQGGSSSETTALTVLLVVAVLGSLALSAYGVMQHMENVPKTPPPLTKLQLQAVQLEQQETLRQQWAQRRPGSIPDANLAARHRTAL